MIEPVRLSVQECRQFDISVLEELYSQVHVTNIFIIDGGQTLPVSNYIDRRFKKAEQFSFDSAAKLPSELNAKTIKAFQWGLYSGLRNELLKKSHDARISYYSLALQDEAFDFMTDGFIIGILKHIAGESLPSVEAPYTKQCVLYISRTCSRNSAGSGSPDVLVHE